MTKLCLINVVDLNSKIERYMPQLGLGYIAAYLQKYSNINKIRIAEDSIMEDIHLFNPDIVGISSVSQNFNRSINLAEKIKNELDIPIIVGGIHISALPHTLQNCFDIAVIGEGEQTMLELLEMFEKNGLDKTGLEKINGIGFHNQNKIEITEKRKLISPLDKIPFPARELLNIKSHTSMITSRGCPYNCVFCASSVYWGKPRFFSPEYIVEEIKELIEKYSVTMIDFWDDLFIANKKRLARISQLLRDEGISNKVSFNCQARTNLMDDETLVYLKNMNVNQLSFGFESGSQKILNYLKKNTVTVEQNRNAVFLSKKYGFIVNGSFIIGSPDETKEDAEKSLKFLKNSDIDSGLIFHLIPYPGTELWNYAKQLGIVDDEMDWNKLYQNCEIIEDFKFAKIDPQKNYIYLNKNISFEDFSDIYLEFQKEFEKREMKINMLFKIEELSKQFSRLQEIVEITKNQMMNDENEINKLKNIEITKLKDIVEITKTQMIKDEIEINKLKDIEIIKLRQAIQIMQNQLIKDEIEIIKLQKNVQQ
jgi:anaerobic magnesium-protoporphyrin IX monomethyl ester cyclase